MSGAIVLIIAISIIIYIVVKRKKTLVPSVLPASSVRLLEEHVHFYGELNGEQRKRFEARVADFLSRTKVTGIGTKVEELDRVLVGASAIIPIFAFEGWRYNNINEVLLYKDTFNKEYHQDGGDRNILGMVGDGALHRQMILSQPALRSGFLRRDAHNTGIHEFVHLLDKADGATDGIPEYLLSKPYIIPWMKEVREEMVRLHQSRDTDINFYAATNEAEFFAVVSEYFFERPHELKEKHPELYGLLEEMFQTETVLIS